MARLGAAVSDDPAGDREGAAGCLAGEGEVGRTGQDAGEELGAGHRGEREERKEKRLEVHGDA